MKQILTVLALAALMTGCTSQAEYLQSLSTYQGMSERDLIEKKGVPTNTYEVDGRKYLSYVTTRRNYSNDPGTSIYGGTGIGNRGAVFGTGIGLGGGTTSYNEISCENTFVIFKGVVERAGYKGDCF